VPVHYACPNYDTCTPTSTLLSHSNPAGHDESTVLGFIPYADDPKFNVQDYVNRFKTHAWRNPEDPNRERTLLSSPARCLTPIHQVELIQMETARRLIVEHRFSREDVDRFGRLKPLRVANKTGLLRLITQRSVGASTGRSSFSLIR
jgi:hypothetical protein